MVGLGFVTEASPFRGFTDRAPSSFACGREDSYRHQSMAVQVLIGLRV